jgi:hypothetical protein
MKHNTYALVTVLLITLVVILRPGLARGSRAAPLVTPVTKTWSIDPDSTARQGIKPGLALRLRFVETENIIGLGAPQFPTGMDIIRIRAQIWADAWFTPNVRGRVQFNHERLDFEHCEICEDRGREIVVENLYVEAFDIGGAPVGLRIGRQNLFYGDGLIICDGTPLDGSRTLYVNAALLSFAIPQWAVDVFAGFNHEKEDLLPAIDDEGLQLVETDECLMGIYAKTMPYRGESRSFTLEPYFIIKREREQNWQDRISTIGGRLSVPGKHTRFRGEAAYQTGHLHHDYSVTGDQEAKNISAFGGTAYFDVMLESYWNLELGAGYVYLAGDNLKTHGKFEGWNPVLGRWPRWSELYIYTLIPEAGVAYWQNIKFPLLQARLEPYKGFTFDARVLWMYANRADPGTCVPPDTEFDEPASMKRGNLYALKFSYRIGRHLSGHLLYEHFSPGGYYDWLWHQCGISGDPRAADFLRLEVSFMM